MTPESLPKRLRQIHWTDAPCGYARLYITPTPCDTNQTPPSSSSTDSATARAETGFAGLRRSLQSWRTASVVLLSFSSGLPLGLVWYAIPDWMRDIGVDIRIVGLLTLAQAPWAFKVLWSPLMDRYVPPFWGRRRGWIAISQVALFTFGLWLAGVGGHPESIWVVGAVALATALASATQDIAYDAYTVDVLRPEEQGTAAGAKTAAYRAAMAVSGGVAITAAGHWGWPVVNLLLALLYLPMLVLTWKASEPEHRVVPPPSLRAAIWQPFVGLLARHRAIEILLFVVLYKLADQLAQSLTRPFLIDMGYSADQRGLALATIGLVATVAGAFLGGVVTTIAGLGHSLWIFGLLQIFSNVGYFLLARLNAPNVALMYAATSFELLTSGLGTGAFSVLLLRLTERRFSATQYALLSSLFALPRLAAGPITGFAVHMIGWPAFYLASMIVGLPGLVMLARFVPPGLRDPGFSTDDGPRADWDRERAGRGGLLGAAVAGCGALAAVTLLIVLERASTGGEASIVTALREIVRPSSVDGWLRIGGVAIVAAVGAVAGAAAAVVSARNRQG